MLGVVGIILAIVLLVVMSWNRWNAIVCAIVATLVVGVFNGFGVWGTLTGYFLPSAGNWIGTFVLMFLSAAMYAKVLNDSGAANRIAYWIVDHAPEKLLYPILILLCMILIYGGVNGLVVVFVFWPLAVPIARRLNKPRYIFLTIMYMGLLGGANWAMPGSPQGGNVAIATILGTPATASPAFGLVVTVLTFAFDVWFVYFLDRWATKKGHTFEEGVGLPMAGRPEETCPGIARSIIPLVVLLALFILFGNGFFGLTKPMGATLAVTSANVIATLACFVVNAKYFVRPEQNLGVFQGMKKSLFEGVTSGFGTAFTMMSMVAFAAVLSATPAFQSLMSASLGAIDNPYLQAVFATQIMGLVCGSQTATATAVCNTFGADWLAMSGVNMDALARITSIGAAGLSTVPYSGGLFANLEVSGCQMKHIWPQQFIACAVPAIAFALIGAGLATIGAIF